MTWADTDGVGQNVSRPSPNGRSSVSSVYALRQIPAASLYLSSLTPFTIANRVANLLDFFTSSRVECAFFAFYSGKNQKERWP